MQQIDYQGFRFDVPDDYGIVTTDNEMVIVMPQRERFTPNLVIRTAPATQTLAELSDQALRNFVASLPTATLVTVDDTPLPCGSARHRATAFASVGSEETGALTLTLVRDLAVIAGQALDISTSCVFEDNPDGWQPLLEVADSARPVAASERGGDGHPVGQEREDLSWVFDVALDLGPLAIALDADALDEFERLATGGRLFRPSTDVAAGPGAGLLAAELVEANGKLSELGSALSEFLRRGAPWEVSYGTRTGVRTLRGWRGPGANLTIVPAVDGDSAQLLLCPDTDAIRHILGWSGTVAAWPRQVEITGLTPEQFARQCAGEFPVAAVAPDEPVAHVTWRNLSLTSPAVPGGYSWVATPHGSLRSWSEPDGTVTVALSPSDEPIWFEITDAWFALTS